MWFSRLPSLNPGLLGWMCIMRRCVTQKYVNSSAEESKMWVELKVWARSSTAPTDIQPRAAHLFSVTSTIGPRCSSFEDCRAFKLLFVPDKVSPHWFWAQLDVFRLNLVSAMSAAWFHSVALYVNIQLISLYLIDLHRDHGSLDKTLFDSASVPYSHLLPPLKE